MATRVEYGFEYLINTGDFENAKVIIHVTDDLRDGENVAQATTRIGDFVEAAVVKRVQEVRAELGK
jgi:hypothetical protein